MNKKYWVRLTPEQRGRLDDLTRTGTAPAAQYIHARILLKADSSDGGPAWRDSAIAAALEISVPTVERVRRAFVTKGLDAALLRRPSSRPSQRKLDGAQEAHLIALACSTPPAGHGRWSVRLLADRLVELQVVDSIGRETVRTTLKKTNSSPG